MPVNQPKLSSKLPEVGTTIFTVMSKMAQDFKAINLSQGFPDFEISSELQDLVTTYMRRGFNQYAPMPGVPDLLNSISRKITNTYGINVNPENEITVTAGATEALYASIAAMVRPGDEVLILEPAYDAYVPAVRLNGGIPVLVPMEVPDFTMDWQRVALQINKRTRLIIINTPHNPTGTILRHGDLSALSEITEKYGIYVLSDEVYEHIIFDDEAHQSVLKYPGLRERSIAVYSFGKTFHATGWKVGYSVASAPLTAEIKKVHQFLTFSVNTPVQYALAAFLDNEKNYQGLHKFFQEKRDYFLQQMEASRFEPVPSKGTYFQLFSYRNYGTTPDREMAEWLTREVGVAAIPISVFYQDKTDNHYLRFCFAKDNQTLQKGARLLCGI